ncbi:DUF481 domain-containing protein [Undibacterium crateris]|uniref:DUF481 domain-containing protein n=1 Tax=Undibacterium crateris TaxID=2528175 RepID=UPI001389C7D4|nr:DUF481 domain-containing protein [Undibacterium crateris]NDI85386.1 DUF481 domain-containing protein [Undibacterium crateris]
MHTTTRFFRLLPLPKLLAPLGLCSMLLSYATPGLAQTAADASQPRTEIWLKNGDKLTGRLLKIGVDKLILKTDYAGEIEIDAEAVMTMSSKESLPLTLPHGDTLRTTIAPRSQSGMVEVAQQLVPLREVSFDQEALEKAVSSFEGNIETSLELARNSSRTQRLELETEGVWNTRPWRHEYHVELNRYWTDRQEKENDSKGSYALDYYLTPKWYVRNNAYYQNDKVANNSSYYYYGVGFGRHIWESEVSNLESLLSFNRLNFSTSASEFHVNAWLWTVKFKRKLPIRNLEIFAKTENILPIGFPVDLLSDSELGLRYQLNRRMYLSTKYGIKANRAASLWMKSHQLRLSIGANW